LGVEEIIVSIADLVLETPAAVRRSQQKIGRLSVSLAALILAGVVPADAAGILTQGGSFTPPVTASVAASMAGAQQEAAMALRSQNELSRISTAMQAMQNLQTAARNLAITAPSVVPDGLVTGGLVPDSGLAAPGIAKPVTDWVGANTPTQTTAAGQTNVTIDQTAPQAILSWSSFNVGKATTVDFNQQGQANWVALNQINQTATPSQILGSIKADGQVYLINQNGIIFGGSSQVNVGALIASSAAISSTQFLSDGIYSTESNLVYAPSFTDAGGASGIGPITVQAGAQIATNAPETVTNGGGYVLLMGTQVQNAGSITTPSGQAELAAGNNFLLRPGYDPVTNATSTTRGNEVGILLNENGSSAAPGGAGLVSNTGVISAATGDITLAGETVQQGGVLDSTTTVAVRGTIHLLSPTDDPLSSVTLAGNSVTVISPDLSSTATALDSQRASEIASSTAEDSARNSFVDENFTDLSLLNDRQDESRVEIVTGGTVTFQNGSQTVAQGGQVAVTAGTQFLAQANALIDVSGVVGVPLPVSANDLAVNVQSYEQRDAPQNRLTTLLRNNTVYVDARTLSVVPASAADDSTRDYTEGGLLEVSGYLNTMGHTIGEWTSLGGTITVETGATGSIIAQPGSDFDLAGGSVQYESGYVQQSYLLGMNGQIYNVNNAPAYITYAGVYDGFVDDHTRWGVSETYSNVLSDPAEIFEQGYVQGRAAGSLQLDAPTTIFAGTIQAGVVNGARQTTAPPAGGGDPYTFGQSVVAVPGGLQLSAFGSTSPLAGSTDVQISDAALPSTSGTAPIPSTDVGTTFFNADSLSNAGLGSLYVLTDGTVNVAAPLVLAPGASVSLYGSTVTIAANITAHAGSVSAANLADVDGTSITLQTTDPVTGLAQSGDITLAAGAAIDTTGMWTNLFLNPGTPSGGAFINGGAVTLESLANLNLEPGSVIDASAGAEVTPSGTVTGGAGGALSLTVTEVSLDAAPGSLNLQGTLRSYGFTAGGALAISAPGIQIGNAVTGDSPGAVLLQPAFFGSGFSSYALNSSAGGFLNAALPASDDVAIAPGTIVNVVEPVYQATAASVMTPTGAPVGDGAALVLNPVYVTNPQATSITQRPGASFNLTAGAITLGAGAAINVDPKQSITLSSTGQITIDGDLSAPGGVIGISNPLSTPTVPAVVNGQNTEIPVLAPVGQLSIWFGSTSDVSTAGEAFTAGNAAGSLISVAPGGGEIVVGAPGGAAGGTTGLIQGGAAVIIAQAGAVLDASGSAAFDRQIPHANRSPLAMSVDGGSQLIPVEGTGGSIVLASTGGIYDDATMRAFAGGPDAAGGTLNISLPTDALLLNGLEDAPRILTITQTGTGPVLPADLQPGMVDAALVAGTSEISAAQITAGGFGTVSLGAHDAIIFDDNVTLSAPQSIALNQGAISESGIDNTVAIDAPYVTLSGQVVVTSSNQPQGTVQAVTGFSAQDATGTFSVNADTIDVVNAVGFGGIETTATSVGTVTETDLADFGTVALHAQGDLRFLPTTVGAGGGSVPATTLISQNNIALTAGRIYATGGTQAQVEAGFLVSPEFAQAFNPDKTLTIARPAGAAVATAPLELGGGLTFASANIMDGGVVWQPLGNITFSGNDNSVAFLPGSVTSVSAAGLNIPFGGTTDGINYSVDGVEIASERGTGEGLDYVSGGANPGTITVQANHVSVASGAVLDVSGGGNLTGEGFISGQGGSTDVLSTPLLQLAPKGGVSQPSLATDPVYAIVAGPQPATAPSQSFTQTGVAGSTPGVGAQVIIPAGVPGLPAGTYTLLPASYALNPGGYRVEFDGAASLSAAPVIAMPNGSYAVAGYGAVADTAVRNTLPTALTITPAATVQNYAQYDTQSYSQFLVANAARIGAVRPALPEDAGTLHLIFPADSLATLSNFGTSNFQAASGGVGGTLVVSGAAFAFPVASFDIYGAAPVAGLPAGTVSLSAAALDGFNAFTMEIGIAGAGFDTNTQGITLENGATLTAARVVLTAETGGITLNTGSEIDTLGRGTVFADSTTKGFFADGGASVLDVGNGYLAYSSSGSSAGFSAYGPITVADGATIYTDGSIAFSTASAVTIGVAANLGGEYLDFALPEINVGDPTSLGAVAAPGLTLTQDVLQRLTAGVPALDVPAVQILVLAAGDSLNFFGTTSLDLSGTNVQLVIDSPAIYGFGGPGDVATIKANTIVWNGISTTDGSGTVSGSAAPGGVIADGPGTGQGVLNFDAQTILLGYSPLDFQVRDVPLSRLTLGFATVNLNASTEITANTQGTLAVYQSQALYGSPGTGGVLNLTTPLLTGADEAQIGFTAGGAINLAPPAGAKAATALPAPAAGAEIDLTAEAVNLNSAVILPSGKLAINATGDIDFGAGSDIDLAGSASTIVNQAVYGFGGALTGESATGNITQDAGGIIDVAAQGNNAGSVSLTATAAGQGAVLLNGALLGSATGAFTSGSFDVLAQSVGDFAALNTALDDGGFFQARSFDIKSGDLTVGNGVKAHQVSISVDGGSLTVNGLIDASGGGAGSITLAAANNLTLAAGAVLDAQGTVLQVDQYGQPVAAANAPVANLTARSGTLTLASGAAINLASADAVARGDLELNVPRLGGVTAGDANIDTQSGVDITGAATIAVNAFATYNGAPDTVGSADGAPDALITQAYLDGINASDTVPFMAAAQTNTDLASRLAGLTSAYGSVFHFRPGVEIVSATANGDLTVQGDIDLAGYRYGPGVNPAIYGSGEPGVLVLRAGGNLNVYGSITDGFGEPVSDVGTSFASGWVLIAGAEPYGHDLVVPTAVTLATGTTLEAGPQGVNYAVPIYGGQFQPNAAAPTPLTVKGDQVTPLTFVATSDITVPGDSTPLFTTGTVVPAGTTLPNGAVIGIGGSFPFVVNVGPSVWPANTPFSVGSNFGFGTTVELDENVTLLPGSLIPAGSRILFPKGESTDGEVVDTRPVGADGSQGQIYPLAQLLPEGDLSWSIQLVGGADTTAANTGIVQPASQLAATATGGDITLSDTHYNLAYADPIPDFSVIRTGTGSLSLVAGGSITEVSDYGIYTAGAQAPAILGADGSNPYDLPQGLGGNGNTLLGPINASDAALVATTYQANYPTDGGNVLIDAQGNINGFINTNFEPYNNFNIFVVDSDAIGSWLWRQGGAGQPGAWWVEYGALESPASKVAQLDGFQGIGTLGGGNLTVDAGGNAAGLNLAVASTGRVQSDGVIAQTGGGNLNLNVGGAVNFSTPTTFGGQQGDAGGLVLDLRGNIAVNAGSIGTIEPTIGEQPNDPRVLPPLESETATIGNGIDLAPGDGTVTVTTRGDQVIDDVVNPGTVQNEVNTTPVDFTDGTQQIVSDTGGATLFSLWSADTSVGLFSAGGDVQPASNNAGANVQNGSPDYLSSDVFYYPPSLSVISQNGNIDFSRDTTELVPSPDGSLDLLAADSILGGGTTVAISGAPVATLATPQNPSIIVTKNFNELYDNASPEQASALFAFGPDTPTGNLHTPGQAPALVYAGSGDIVDLQLGYTTPILPDGAHIPQYIGAMPFDVVAGEDIVNLGTVGSPDLFLNLSPTDVTSITAGRDILQSSADIAGPGTLFLQAGRNVYQGDQGVLDSVGPVFDINPNDRNSGATIVVIAGVGTAGPDYGNFENLYLNPASTLNLQDAGEIITDNDAQLYAYLQADYGYTGPQSGAYAYFLQHLSPAQQHVYLLDVYYAELNSSGLEYNDPTSVRYRSYVRGRDAIAALFPGYGTVPDSPDTGDITLFGNSGIQTQFGGAIETLTPGGQTIVGVEGTTPASSAGFVTQGSGDIDVYAQDSVLLGQSRVLTTFGGNILIWSATGDINAGQGNKTTIDYTPLQRVYDPYGDVSLSPTVPSSGAGIGTLNPIPQVAAGNINLVAPLGTVDAGEAGIRVSGNLNIAALHVLNTANISVQGTSTGVPVAAAPNVGALSAAGNASGAAVQAAESTGNRAPSNQPTIWIVEVLGYGGGDAGPAPSPPVAQPQDEKRKKKPTVQADLAAFGGQA
jgi:filamentous hemagglutinin family protein